MLTLAIRREITVDFHLLCWGIEGVSKLDDAGEGGEDGAEE